MNRSRARTPRSPAWWVGTLGLIALVRCGGTSSPSKTTTEGLAIDAGASCPPNAKGQLHRCQSPTCPANLGGQPLPCTSDGDCELDDAGVLYQGTCRAGVCRLDQCLTDRDCPSNTACNCRGDFGSNHGGRNWCEPANCRTDSDCGPGGVCSPSISSGPCGYLEGFFCRTPQDTCATDTDCASQGSGMSCEYFFPQVPQNSDGGPWPPGYWKCQGPGHCTSG
jgi:hypothetical protein